MNAAATLPTLPDGAKLELTPNERALITAIANTFKTFRIDEMRRDTEREFDVTIQGEYNGTHFRSWLPLAAIRELRDWTKPTIANLSEYPEMAREGDWSGIRDSSTDTIWLIFEIHIERQHEITGRYTK